MDPEELFFKDTIEQFYCNLRVKTKRHLSQCNHDNLHHLRRCPPVQLSLKNKDF